MIISTEPQPLTAKSLGAQMREDRIEAGMSVTGVATRLFVTAGCIKNWELGYRMPGVVMLDRFYIAIRRPLTLGAVG